MAKRQRQHDDDAPPPHTDQDAPGNDQGQGGPAFNPFLKVDHINAQGPTRFNLTGYVRSSIGAFGPQVVIEVQGPNGVMYDFAVKEGSPNHRMLWRAFGGDTSKWRGHIIVQRDRFKLQRGDWSNWSVNIVEVSR